MRKIVILKRHFTDSQQGRLLKECLRTLFPECEIEVREKPSEDNPGEEIYSNINKNQNIM